MATAGNMLTEEKSKTKELGEELGKEQEKTKELAGVVQWYEKKFGKAPDTSTKFKK